MNTLTPRTIPSLLYILATALWLLAPDSPLSAIEPGETRPVANPTKVPEALAPSDWKSIRATYEAQRHAAFVVEGGYQAWNPGQQWRTKFDARGFNTQPDAGGWQWGLELRSYGFAGQKAKQIEGLAQEVKVEGERVTYTWDGALEEWFVNDQRGLEHGFTVKARPHGGGAFSSRLSSLDFILAVRGGLRPELSPDGKAVRFVDEEGATVINYAGLKVWDADGRSLPAQFAPAEDCIRLSVDERGARYPITVDPIAQQAYLKASNTEAGDSFGTSVAISGDTVVVGAPFEDSGAKAINGDQNDNSVFSAGAVYIFVRINGVWSQQAYLKPSKNAGEAFGRSVAISGDTVVVSAPHEDTKAENSGAAYIFVRSGGIWSEEAIIKASNAGQFDQFGFSLAISGETVVVGAPQEDSNAAGIKGDVDNNSGAAYVFVRSYSRSGASWTQQAYLKASNTEAFDWFGWSVGISGETVVVGAVQEDSSAPGVNGNESDNTASSAGAAYVFVRSSNTWTQQAYLKASNAGAGDWFGGSVAISGDSVVVGAPGEESSAAGVDGNQNDNSADGSGAAYVFVRSNGMWTQQAYLKASNTDAYDGFGREVAISGGTVVVGVAYEDSGATGVNGYQGDNLVREAGAAYVFVRNGVTWTQQAYLKALNTAEFDYFGSVAVDGGTVIVGAVGEDSSAKGVNGNQSDNGAIDAGAVYIFTDLARATFANISTRSRVGTGDNALIGGFIVTGTQPKKVIIRALGPSLKLAEQLANPTIELFQGNTRLDSNDNWMDSPNRQAIIDSTIPPSHDLESAIVATLPANNTGYTAIVRGANGGTGLGVIEAYDLDTTVDSRLANISTRGLVLTGDNVLIAGTIVVGQAPQRVLIRAIGPSLSIAPRLEYPTLELRDANGAVLEANDDWINSPNKQAIIASTLQPTHDRESAIIRTLPANGAAYTAIVRGYDNTTGIAVVEVYALQ